MALPLFELEHGAIKQSLALWGLSQPVLTFSSQDKGKLTLRYPGANPAADPVIPYYDVVKLYRDGVKVFEGRQVDDGRMAKAGGQAAAYTFADAWYDLSYLPFQQIWKYQGGAQQKRYSRYYLFVDNTTGAYITNGAQVAAVIDYAILCGVQVAKGVIDIDTYLPVYPARAMMCSEVIELCLRPQADAVTWLDHSTSPPTFHCRKRQNLAAVTMPFKSTAGGVVHKTSNLRPRPDLMVRQVVIDYQKTVTATVNGQSQTQTDFATDAYPPESTGQAVGAIVLPIDLRGAFAVDLVGTVVAGAFSATDVNWWKTKVETLADGRASGVALLQDADHPVTVTDETGAVVNLTTYPNELLDGAIYDWMSVSGAPVVATPTTITVKAWFRYAELDAKGLPTKTHEHELQTVRVKLTNSAVGSVQYSFRQSADTGETPPPNLALSIYNSLATLQWEGTHAVQEQTPSQKMAIVGPWNVLNLSGGAAAWTTMKAVIQSATHDFFAGTTVLTLGPARHLAPGDLAQLLIWARLRLTYENPVVQRTGIVQGQTGKADVGGKTVKENSTSGLSAPSFLTSQKDVGGGQSASVQMDAGNKQINIIQVVQSTGVLDPSKGQIVLHLGDCLGSDGQMHKVYIQEVPWYDENCNLMHRLVVCSDPY